MRYSWSKSEATIGYLWEAQTKTAEVVISKNVEDTFLVISSYLPF